MGAAGAGLVLDDCDLLGVDWDGARLELVRSMVLGETEVVVAMLARPGRDGNQPSCEERRAPSRRGNRGREASRVTLRRAGWGREAACWFLCRRWWSCEAVRDGVTLR